MDWFGRSGQSSRGMIKSLIGSLVDAKKDAQAEALQNIMCSIDLELGGLQIENARLRKAHEGMREMVARGEEQLARPCNDHYIYGMKAALEEFEQALKEENDNAKI